MDFPPRLLAAAACLACLAFSTLNAAERPPNVVLIMADDLGFETLSCNGGATYDTPNLDRLAAEGVRFTHCYSTPLCTPSRVQIMTGRYNFRNYDEFGYLDPKEKTFGNLMRHAGYATCIAGKWQLNGLSYPEKYPESFRMDRKRPHAAGFDQWCLWQLTRERRDGERFANALVDYNGEEFKRLEGGYGPDAFRDFILNFITEHKDGPFFVYYPMVLTHDPFVPTPDSPEWADPKKRMKKDNRFFKDMVEYMDKNAGKIVAHLEKEGLMENTLLIFTGDNGTKGSITSKMRDGSTITGGKGTTPDAGTHVPLIACWRGKSPGAVCEDLIDFTDVYPTLASVVGTDVSGEVLDGRSFLPQIRGEKGNPRDWVFCHYTPRWGSNDHTRFVRDHVYKLYIDGRFYNVPADVLEKNALTPEDMENPAARERLQAVLDSMPPWTEEDAINPRKKERKSE